MGLGIALPVDADQLRELAGWVAKLQRHRSGVARAKGVGSGGGAAEGRVAAVEVEQKDVALNMGGG